MRVNHQVILKYLRHHGFMRTYSKSSGSSISAEKKAQIPVEISLSLIGEWHKKHDKKLEEK